MVHLVEEVSRAATMEVPLEPLLEARLEATLADHSVETQTLAA
jgi:hypothetical protein